MELAISFLSVVCTTTKKLARTVVYDVMKIIKLVVASDKAGSMLLPVFAMVLNLLRREGMCHFSCFDHRHSAHRGRRTSGDSCFRKYRCAAESFCDEWSHTMVRRTFFDWSIATDGDPH